MAANTKRWISFLTAAVLLMTSLMTGVTPVATAEEAATDKVSIALDSAVLTASGAHSSFPMSGLVDGKLTTGWSSDPNTYEQNTHAWIQLQLPQATLLDEVRLYPRYETVNGQEVLRCFPTEFTIQVSGDGVTWKTVSTQTDYTPTGKEWQVFCFAQQMAVQYIKVDATKLYTENPSAAQLSYRCQFMEMEAYYTPLADVAAYAAAMDAVAIDRQNACLLYSVLPGITTTLKSTSNTAVVDTDGSVDTVNSGSCDVVLTLSDGTTAVDTARFTVTVVGVAEQPAEKAAVSAATASSEANSNWGAAKLIDGNRQTGSTGWSSKQYTTAAPTNADGAEWAMLTLAEPMLVKRVDIYPRYRTSHRGMPTDFAIQVSADGTQWTTAYSAVDYAVSSNEAMQSVAVTPTYGRYVRLWCTKLNHDGDNYSVQLAEMEVYGVAVSLQSAAEAAAALTVKPVQSGDTAVKWQTIDNRYFKVAITQSEPAGVIATDRTITVPEKKTEVTLTLKVTNRLNPADAATVQRKVTVNSPNGLLAEAAAASIDLLPLPEAEATAMPMPTPQVDNAEAFAVTIESSSHPTVVATDGTITRPSATTGVRLRLRVTHKASGEYALTDELLVPIYKPVAAQTMTDAQIDADLDKFEKRSYGFFVHYVPAVTDTKEAGKVITSGTVYADGTKVTEVDALADNFDAEQFAKELSEFGVEYVMFTVWHADMRSLFPSMTNERWRDDRRSEDTLGMKSYADTDLIEELLTALEPYGIDLYLYTHPCDGHDLTAEDQALTGWNDATDSYATWNQYINELYYELCERYGTRIKALYFDGWYNHIATGAPQQRLRETCLTFNPAMALIMNAGFDQVVNPAPLYNGADYRAWEIRPTDLETLKVSHNQSAMVVGGEWFTTSPQTQQPSTAYNSAESLYRYTALMSTISTHGGFAASLAVYPERENENLDTLWAYGIYELFTTMNDTYLQGVAESVKNVIPSTAYPTAEESTLATLKWGAAAESADGAYLYLHVLTAPDGDALTLPATADGSVPAAEGVLLNFDGTATAGVRLAAAADGGYTVTLPSGCSWSAVDTVIKVALTRPAVESVTLSSNEVSVVPNGSRQLGFTVLPAEATAQTVCWESSDRSVVTVNRQGVVTATGTGEATVTVTVNGKTAVCTVSVSENANRMQNGDFEGDNPLLDWYELGGTVVAGAGRNGSAALVRGSGSVYLKGQNFTLLPNRYYEFSLYFKGETGDTGKVWYNTGTADNNNRDVQPIAGTKTIGKADADGWKQYTCVLQTGDNPKLVSNYAIALSNFNEGTAIDDVCLRLLPALTSLKLNTASLQLRPGTAVTMTAETQPADAYAGSAVWRSDNEAVATVDSSGNITAQSEGVAVITATAGTVSSRCVVTVSPYANVIVNGDFELGATAEWGNNSAVTAGADANGGYALVLSGATGSEQYYKGKLFAALEDNTAYVLMLDYKNVGGGYPELYINYGGKGNTVNGENMIQATKLKDSDGAWKTVMLPFTTGTIAHSNTGWELALIRRVDKTVNGSADGTSYFDNLRIVKQGGAYAADTVNGTLVLSDGETDGLHLDAVSGQEVTVTVTPKAGYQLVPGSLCYRATDGTQRRILNKASGEFGEGSGLQFAFTMPADTTVAVTAEFVSTADTSLAVATVGTSVYYAADNAAPQGVRFLNRMAVEGLNVNGAEITVRYGGVLHTVAEFGSLLKRNANTAELTLETAEAYANSSGALRMWKAGAYTKGDDMKLVDYTAAYVDFTVVMRKGADVAQSEFENRVYTVRGYVILDDGTVLYTEAMTDSVAAAQSRGA